jgi:hypothetical protein
MTRLRLKYQNIACEWGMGVSFSINEQSQKIHDMKKNYEEREKRCFI